MKFEEMQMHDYSAMLQTRHQAATMFGMTGMEPWPYRKAARLMAIVQIFGNNEGFTLSPKFQIDREYIQSIYHIGGGEIPNQEFAEHLRSWVRLYESINDENDLTFIAAKDWIMQMYDFKLIC